MMDVDTVLVIGMVLAVFAIPAIVSAISDGRPPRVASIVILVAGGCLAYAMMFKPGGYQIAEIPNIVTTVISRFIN